MTSRSPLSTRVLLICAAVAVGTGLLSAIAGYLTIPVVSFWPIFYGFVLSMHLLPGIVAQEILRTPWVALITHLLAALVALAVSPQWFLSYIAAVAIMGGVQEGWAAIGRYRKWSVSWIVIGGAVLGLLLGLTAGLGIGISKFGVPLALVSVLVYVAGGAFWTFIGVLIGRSIRKAGLARTVTDPTA